MTMTTVCADAIWPYPQAHWIWTVNVPARLGVPESTPDLASRVNPMSATLAFSFVGGAKCPLTAHTTGRPDFAEFSERSQTRRYGRPTFPFGALGTEKVGGSNPVWSCVNTQLGARFGAMATARRVIPFSTAMGLV